MNILVRATIYISIAVILLWLLLTLFGPLRKGRPDRGLKKRVAEAPRACPLCGEILASGERVKTRVNPGKADRLMQILGCPYCYPPNGQYKRICPVCEKEVPREGYVIARLFESTGRKHVHVLGCSGCRHG